MSVITVASEQELLHIDKMLENLDLDIAVSMSYVRKVQRWTFPQLSERFSNIDEIMWKRYMQPSYPSTRPTHVVAAYSWVTMVPITSFYYGLKIREAYRGMDDAAVEALICTGRIPNDQFQVVLNLIYNMLTDDGRASVDLLKEQLIIKYGDIATYQEQNILPPKVLDIKKFGIDYYRSIAIAMKKFRLDNGFSLKTMARVFGLSEYKYHRIEALDIYQPFPMSVGIRLRLGFKASHVNFTGEMVDYSVFHTLRIAQDIRDSLLVESLKYLSSIQKRPVIAILKNLSNAYIDSLYNSKT